MNRGKEGMREEQAWTGRGGGEGEQGVLAYEIGKRNCLGNGWTRAVGSRCAVTHYLVSRDARLCGRGEALRAPCCGQAQENAAAGAALAPGREMTLGADVWHVSICVSSCLTEQTASCITFGVEQTWACQFFSIKASKIRIRCPYVNIDALKEAQIYLSVSALPLPR